MSETTTETAETPQAEPDSPQAQIVAPTAEEIEAGAQGEAWPEDGKRFTVTNPGPKMIVARHVVSRDYTLSPGESIKVDARTALLLETYGATMTLAEHNTAVRVESDPVTGDETRFTGTTQGVASRQHRMDDPRANVAGTPVSITGDTGSNTNARAEELGGPDIPGEPAITNPVEAITKGNAAKNDASSQPPVKAPRRKPTAGEKAQAKTAAEAAASDEPDQGDEDDDEGEEAQGESDQSESDQSEPEAKTPGPMSQAAARAIDQPASTGTMRAVAKGAASAPRSGTIPAVHQATGSTDTAWIQTLDRQSLNAELERRGFILHGSTTEKRAALTAHVAEHGDQAPAPQQ